jgi:CYTH domain-containing protein
MAEHLSTGHERHASPLEIERKFLVDMTLLSAALQLPLEDYPHHEMRQGYVAITEVGAEIRVRHVGDEYTLTAKSGGTLLRQETEITISKAVFDELWAQTDEPDARRIQKVRFFIPHNECVIELDIYGGGLAGLVTAEVAFADIAAARQFTPPSWMGAEVTEDTRYKNQSLAIKGVPNDGC